MIARHRIALLAATIPLLAGCGVYLHRAELETSTAALKTSFGALSAPAYLEQQQRQLEEYATREDRAVAEFNVASRDNSLLNVVGSPDPAAQISSLKAQIEDLMKDATGVEVLPDPDALSRERFQHNLATTRVRIAEDLLTTWRSDYRARGGTSPGLSCAQILEGGEHSPAADPAPAKAVYRQLVQTCRDQHAAQETLDACAPGFASGNLHQACGELAALRSELGGGMDRVSGYRKAVEALRKALDPATGTPPRGSERFRELVDFAREQPTLDDYQDVLEALDSVFGLELADSLSRLSQQRDRLLSHPVIDSTYNALVALEALADLREQRAALDQPSALLIGLAKVRHDLNIVEIEVDRIRRLIALKEAEVDALRLQIHYLARAQCALEAGARSCVVDGQPFAEALSHYVSSFDRGLIPYQVLRARELQVGRAAAIRSARATEADYRALLQPAIDQLAAYGAGGIRPEVLGPFLANLPVTGAIIGR